MTKSILSPSKNSYFTIAILLPIAMALVLFVYLWAFSPYLGQKSHAYILSFLILAASLVMGTLTRLALQNRFAHRIRRIYERIIRIILFLCSFVAVLTTVGIIFSLIFETLAFFKQVALFDFLFGLKWSPQSAFHYKEKTAGVDFFFGAIPVLLGTITITIIAMTVCLLIGLSSAIYLSEYASLKERAILKPALEILAGIPTVVYGFFAAITVAPLIKNIAGFFGLQASSESALAAGLVMGIMLIPFISSLSDDIFHTIPKVQRYASYAMGATKSETVFHVLLPIAMPGLIGAILLAVSRAIGETMIVVMAAGLAANLTLNPFESVTTVTVQIVTLLVGDQEFDSPKTLAAFALGFLLFLITLILNMIALMVRTKLAKNVA